MEKYILHSPFSLLIRIDPLPLLPFGIDLGEDTAKILQVFDLSDLDPRVAESKKLQWYEIRRSPVEVGISMVYNRLVVYPCLSHYLHGSIKSQMVSRISEPSRVWYTCCTPMKING